MSSVTLFLVCSVPFVLVAWAWAFVRKATAARAKAEVYQEFADTFRAMGSVVAIRDKERRKRETQQRYMNLALVDPLVRDGLRDALSAADEYWTHA